MVEITDYARFVIDSLEMQTPHQARGKFVRGVSESDMLTWEYDDRLNDADFVKAIWDEVFATSNQKGLWLSYYNGQYQMSLWSKTEQIERITPKGAKKPRKTNYRLMIDGEPQYFGKRVDLFAEYDKLTAAGKRVDIEFKNNETKTYMNVPRTNYCGCCGREITNPESVFAGIGPICRAKGN